MPKKKKKCPSQVPKARDDVITLLVLSKHQSKQQMYLVQSLIKQRKTARLNYGEA